MRQKRCISGVGKKRVSRALKDAVPNHGVFTISEIRALACQVFL
jgi:hypothetical protein